VEAAKRGALALAIRSTGTDRDRVAHTGAMGYDIAVPRIPAFAVSVPDAELITRLVARGSTPRLAVNFETRSDVDATTHNVIAEVPGTDLAQEIVLIGAHLDSWDLGQGAVDDGAGIAIVSAAAALIQRAGKRPRRTVRVVLFGNEENGFDGARGYGDRHGSAVHQLVAESDFGAGNIYRFQTRVRPEALGVAMVIADQLKLLGVEAAGNEGRTGADTGVIQRVSNLPVLSFSQDGTDYFDYHHTANDTLDKIDPVKLRQNVAVWATAVWLSAQSPVAFHPLPPAAERPAR
jgi:Zn-dependent M28 family amino/carboxypeptidase